MLDPTIKSTIASFRRARSPRDCRGRLEKEGQARVHTSQRDSDLKVYASWPGSWIERIAKTRDCEVDCEEINASHRVLIDERNRARQDYQYVCSSYVISAVQSICINVSLCVTVCDGDDAVLQCAPSYPMPLIDFTGRKHASALRLIGN